MNFLDMVSFAKLFTMVFSGYHNVTMSSGEMDSACEVLKNMADQHCNWNQEQKEIYKMMVDFTKDQMKGQR